MLSGALALLLGRIIQVLGPQKPRPAHLPGFECSFDAMGLSPDWSSFPSDTAGLAMALTVVIWRSSRKMGLLAALWTCVICSARIVEGYHYLSDILAGVGLGAASAALVSSSTFVATASTKLAQRALASAPSLFYFAMIFTLFQFATMFDDVRTAATGVLARTGIIDKSAQHPPLQPMDGAAPAQSPGHRCVADRTAH
jgi:hypothetical protein